MIPDWLGGPPGPREAWAILNRVRRDLHGVEITRDRAPHYRQLMERLEALERHLSELDGGYPADAIERLRQAQLLLGETRGRRQSDEGAAAELRRLAEDWLEMLGRGGDGSAAER